MLKRFLVVVALVTGLAGALVPAGSASAAVGGRPIAPGVRMVTAGTPCTAGAVMHDARGRTLVAYAAACAASRRLGTPVRFTTERGRTLAWGRLVWKGQGLALVKVNPRRTTAAMPVWGGPTGVASIPATGERVFTVGRTADGLSPRSELVTAGSRLSPALAFRSADRGAPVLDDQGRLVGLIGGVSAGSVTIVPLADALGHARTHGVRGLVVKRGGAFSPSAVY